ncbi:PPK2 family polyphosphate kinase [Pseudoduganella sp. UC29_106]|uniref:PPK2 family polyphosphate kinase n=1 Tax=Pseudoduganella sp. UC29_106 TaxID=3374553 RepID=UPI003757D557
MKATEQFRAPEKLKLRDKNAAGPHGATDKHEKILAEMHVAIASLQEMLFAERRKKLLVVLQGTDTSGKDGTVRALFSRISPMGLRAVGFKAPTAIEAAHDYLWRVHREVPQAGEIAVFNRSHYEEVLITRVQGMITPGECKRRYAQIRDFERMLSETGTTIVKIFLHISKEEQRQRLQARLDNPEKHWKFDPEDLKQREYWNDYLRAYEAAIMETDAKHAPWYIVPANSKPHRNLIVAKILLETMQGMKLKFPPPAPGLDKIKIK